jgi:hypothetical protein
MMLIMASFALGIFIGRWSVLDQQKRERDEVTRLIGKCQFNMTPFPGEGTEEFRERIIANAFRSH